MTKKIPAPFAYRGGLRATVTLRSGKRVTEDFGADELEKANGWIVDQLANHNDGGGELGGPTVANLAQALLHYAGIYTIGKGGRNAELLRINHYLKAGGLKPQVFVIENDKLKMVDKPSKALPSAFKAHQTERLQKRSETYATISALAKRKVSTLKKVDFRKLMVCMKAEGLSDSTIQKEIALLKHLFNVAVDEWDWKDLPNPCVGLRLAGSKTRFVVVTSEQQHALRAALAECDNPYFWPMVEIVVETTLRKGSLLEMSRDNVDLENRVAHLWGKGRMVHIPLSLKTVEILKGLPEHPSRKYFPMTPNAVDMAWSGVRDKIGMPQLQFRDLRHVGATAYARHGMNSHQLQVQLGHSSTRMAEVYCNLVGQDSLDALDRIAKTQTVFEMPPPSNAPGDKIMGRNKAQRLANAFLAKVKEANATNAPTTAATTVASGSPGAAMPESMPRAPMDATEQFLASVAADTPDAAQLEPPTHAPQQEVHKQTAIERPQEMPLVDNEPRGTAPHHCPVQSGPLSEEYPQHQATGTYEGTAAPRGNSSGIEGALASNVIKVNFGRK